MLAQKANEAERAKRRERSHRQEHDSAFAAVRTEMQKLALVARQTTNGVVITDTDGRVEWVNAAFSRFTGYSLREIRGRKPGEVLQGPKTDPEAVKTMRRALQERRPCSVEILNYAKNGRPYWVSLQISPLFDSEGLLTAFIGLQTEITEQRLTRERLERSEQRFRDIVDAAGEYVWETDAEGRFSHLSPRVNETLGYAPQAMLGRRPLDFVPAGVHQRVLRILEFGRRRPRAFRRLEHPTRRADGTVIWLRIAGRPVHDAEGNFLGYRGMARDITAEKEAATRLVAERDLAADLNRRLASEIERTQTLAQAAESASKAKSQFLAGMSHELRTPLNAILGMTEGLLAGTNGSLTDRQEESLRVVERSGTHLLELINEVLDLARIEAGRLELECSLVDLRAKGASCLDFVRPLAEAKRLNLRLRVPRDLPLCTVDPRRTRQILLNLLSNAVKFTPEDGFVELRAYLETGDREGAPTQLCLEVEDNGIGISPADLSTLFEPFHQVDNELNRVHDGTGLGLSLVRRLAELHGGTVSVQSTRHLGSTFTVRLPQPHLAESGGVRGDPSRAATPSPFPETRRAPYVLCAEVDRGQLATLESYLEAHQFEVATAQTADELLRLVEADPPDALLLAAELQAEGAPDLVAALRGLPGFGDRPIITLSPPTGSERPATGPAANAPDPFTRPVPLRDLLRCLRNHLAPAAAPLLAER